MALWRHGGGGCCGGPLVIEVEARLVAVHEAECGFGGEVREGVGDAIERIGRELGGRLIFEQTGFECPGAAQAGRTANDARAEEIALFRSERGSDGKLKACPTSAGARGRCDADAGVL